MKKVLLIVLGVVVLLVVAWGVINLVPGWDVQAHGLCFRAIYNTVGTDFMPICNGLFPFDADSPRT